MSCSLSPEPPHSRIKDKAVDVRQVGRELGVQYILQGSLQSERAQVRITTQFIDATNGNQLWSERYDRPLDSVFAIQDEVTRAVVKSLPGQHGVLAQSRREMARRKTPEDLRAYDLFYLAMEAKHLFTKASNEKAKELLNKALELDPSYARGYLGLAKTYEIEVDNNWGKSWEQSMDEWSKAARKAVALDPSDSEGRWQLGLYYHYSGDTERAVSYLEESLELNPNNADVLAHSVFVRVRAGQPEKALESVERAVRLNPHHPNWYFVAFRDAYFHNRRFRDAIAATKKRINESPVWDPLFRSLSYAQLGRRKEADADIAAVLKLRPDFSAEKWISETGIYLRNDERDLFLDSVRKVGLSICATEEQLERFPKIRREHRCEVERANG